MPKASVFYLLVEESNREFEARALIAVIAASRGHRAIICPQWRFWEDVESFTQGAVLFKGNNGVQLHNMRRIKAHGHAIVSIEEEAFGVMNEREITRLYHKDIATACDLALVQSPFHASCVENTIAGMKGRVAVVGNPRADLLRAPFNDEIRAAGRDLRELHGSYILLNSNYGNINPPQGDALTMFNRYVSGDLVDPNDPADVDDFFTWCHWEWGNSRELVATAVALRKSLPELRVIFRPHPAEGFKRWADILAHINGLDVILEGGHLPWISGAEVLVHAGCTTGMEAAVMGVPAICLTPGENRWHEMNTASIANPTARTASNALYLIHSHIKSGGQELHDRMAQCDYSQFLEVDSKRTSAERIVDTLQSVLNPPVSSSALSLMDRQTRLTEWQETKYTIAFEEAKSTMRRLAQILGVDGSISFHDLRGGTIEVAPV